MSRQFWILALLLSLSAGCGQAPTPIDLTQAALQQVHSGEYDAAIASASAAIKINPKAPANFLYRGRAHQFRNSMGDRERALADFNEAIRLAPESSDAYYSRAILYRELGETELAATDDHKARQLDGLIRDTYQKLPDLTPSASVAKETDKPIPKGDALIPKDEDQQRAMYENLKGRCEPQFGKLNTRDKQRVTNQQGGLTGTLGDRYRGLLEGRMTGGNEQVDPAGAEMADPLDGRSAPQTAEQTPLTNPMNPAAANPLKNPMPATPPGVNPLGGNATNQPAAPRGNWNGPSVPPVTSPFAQRPTSPGMSPPGMSPPGTQSPFSRPNTGYTEPVNPFGAGMSPSAQQRGITPPASRYRNQDVRPAFPRDYVP